MSNTTTLTIVLIAVIVNVLALLLAARVLVDAVKDRSALSRRGIENGRRVVAEGEVREGLVRFFLTGVLSVAMMMVLYVLGTSSGRFRPPVTGVAVVLLIAAGLLTFDAVAAQRTRRKLMRRMREDVRRDFRDGGS